MYEKKYLILKNKIKGLENDINKLNYTYRIESEINSAKEIKIYIGVIFFLGLGFSILFDFKNIYFYLLGIMLFTSFSIYLFDLYNFNFKQYSDAENKLTNETKNTITKKIKEIEKLEEEAFIYEKEIREELFHLAAVELIYVNQIPNIQANVINRLNINKEIKDKLKTIKKIKPD